MLVRQGLLAMATYDGEQPGYNSRARAMFFVLFAAVLLAVHYSLKDFGPAS